MTTARIIAPIAAALALGFTACPPSPQPPDAGSDSGTPLDAAPADDVLHLDDVQAACANLAAAGCPEGGPRCYTALAHALDAGISLDIDAKSVACVAHIAYPDVAHVRACGPSWCP